MNATINPLIVTILIQMHGTVITYELTPEKANIFENVRLLCKAGGLKEYVSGSSGMPALFEELLLYRNLKDIFKKDIDKSTFEIISGASSGLLIGNVTFDKTLSRTSGEGWSLTDSLQGIYLLSVHRGRRLIYPTNQEEKVINLLNIEDLYRLALYFNSRIPNLDDLSIPFPNQETYIKEEKAINADTTLSEHDKKQKIMKIRSQFMDLLDKWELTLGPSGNIEFIKLSSLVELVKIIIGNEIIINLLDYSCNAPTSYIPEETNILSKYIVEADIESGLPNTGLGGKRKKRRKTKNKKRKRRKISRKNVIRKT